ncbi:Hint domain-containing protein [Shimia sp.]|uniref:Hint domain-containing protein n=1 Tax=Shimia sp. TaxID=1954381 RepID=UPI003298F1CB
MPDPYISEVKYFGTAALDFIEVAVDAGTDVSGIFVTVYRSNGTVRSVNALETYVSTNAGRDVYLISTSDSSTFNGLSKSGAVALSQDGDLLQFISFDDAAPVDAVAGVANGETSDQIGQAGAGESLESTDGGASYETQTNPNGGTIPCFLKNTRIATPDGWVHVQDLKPDDSVCDAQGNTLVVRQVLLRKVGIAESIYDYRLRPVLIRAGSLGAGLPERNLYLSRQHRVLVGSKIVRRMFGVPQVLVAAHQFLKLDRVELAPVTGAFHYYHLLLERHGVVVAEGLSCESFLIAQSSISAISDAARKHVFATFPESRAHGYQAESAALIPSRKQQQRLIERHLKNNKPFGATQWGGAAGARVLPDRALVASA